MLAWRNMRDGKIGIATNGRGSRNMDTVYDDSDISATSNSRLRSMRKKRFLDRQVQIVEVDSVRLHGAVHQRTRAIVVPAGKRQSQFGHDFSA
jgi:hypothetical protein